MGLQAFLQHPEPRAATDVGAKRHADTRFDMPSQWKNPAAKCCVAARAVSDCSTGRGQPPELGIGRVNVVRHDSARATERVSLVDGEIVARPRKQTPDLNDLADTL